jgi:hypothetical protein
MAGADGLPRCHGDRAENRFPSGCGRVGVGSLPIESDGVGWQALGVSAEEGHATELSLAVVPLLHRVRGAAVG